MLTATPFALPPGGSAPVTSGAAPGPTSVARAGSWRYRSPSLSRPRLASAMAISLAVHLAIFFGFGHKKPVVQKVKAENLIQLTIAIPQLKELEEEEITNSDGEQHEDLGTPVPTQADVPSVPQPSDFVQQIDFTSLVEKPDVSNVKLAAIPEHILRGGGKGGEGLGMIFNIADLDRVPEPVVQIPPVFPNSLKRETSYAEVRVEFIVDANGRVLNPFVVETTHSGFNTAAIRGVEKWKFRAGIRAGKKVNTRMQVPLIFRIVE